MTGRIRTALYLRVSTPDQKPDLQYDGLRAYAERAGLLVVGDYCDYAVSGRRKGRPQLNALMTSVQDQIDTDSPMGRAMFTIVGAMAELESSLISERVSAGMKAAAARGKHLGRPPLAPGLVKEIKMLAVSTNLSIREIHKKIGRMASRGRVGEITKQIRSAAR